MRPPGPTRLPSALGVILLSTAVALAAGCATSKPLTIHRGEIPRTVGTVVPHVIEGVPAEQANSRPPRDLPFGYTEDQLPLGLTAEGIGLGLTVAIAIVAGGVTAMLLASALRHTPLMSSSVPLAAEVADSGTHFPMEFSELQRIPVLHSATEVALPPSGFELPPVPHSSMAQGVPVPHTDGDPDIEMAAAPLEAGPADSRRKEPIRLPVPIEGAHAPGARPLADGASSEAYAEARERIGRVVQQFGRWAVSSGQASRERLAALPREAWNDFDRRRSPFRDGGEFWVQGVALTRMGAPEDAERHFWNGYYLCQHREWPVEAAECLRRLASLAQQRGDIDEARAHFEAAAATFEQHRDHERLRAVRRELDGLPTSLEARAHDFLTDSDLPAAADRA